MVLNTWRWRNWFLLDCEEDPAKLYKLAGIQPAPCMGGFDWDKIVEKGTPLRQSDCKCRIQKHGLYICRKANADIRFGKVFCLFVCLWVFFFFWLNFLESPYLSCTLRYLEHCYLNWEQNMCSQKSQVLWVLFLG